MSSGFPRRSIAAGSPESGRSTTRAGLAGRSLSGYTARDSESTDSDGSFAGAEAGWQRLGRPVPGPGQPFKFVWTDRDGCDEVDIIIIVRVGRDSDVCVVAASAFAGAEAGWQRRPVPAGGPGQPFKSGLSRR